MEQLPLRDIHLPEPVSWWPPAIGWWLLALLVPVLITGLVWLIRRRRRVTPIMLALRELDFLQGDAGLSPDAKLRRLSILLRQTALTLYPRQSVAGLTGEDWLRWLDETLGEPRFSQGPGRLLVEAPYRPAPAANLDALLALCRDWLLVLSKTQAGRRALPRTSGTKRAA
jgi:hypothetical protein